MWDSDHGCVTEGTIGRAHHLGEPLTAEQIRLLPDGTEVVVTWAGGNGPHAYRILVDSAGDRRVQTVNADPLLPWDGTDRAHPAQGCPLNRVTEGWDGPTRELAESRPPEPDHILGKWALLRAS